MAYSNNIEKNNFTKVANLKDFQEGSLMKVEIKGKSVVLAMVNGQIHAMNSVCSHQGGPLEEGILEGYDITCPLHYAVFDIRNGKVSDSTVWVDGSHGPRAGDTSFKFLPYQLSMVG